MPDNEISIKRGEFLPHWIMDKAIYNVCFRLSDSLPSSVIHSYQQEKASILDKAKSLNRELTDNELTGLQQLYSSKIDAYLDKGKGDCYLKRTDITEIVASVLRHFDNLRYLLHAWSVMPNHIHVIVEPYEGYELFKILHSWKSFSANQINKLLGLSGSFWHKDAYNHIIRSEKAYAYQMEYVWLNSERAGLKDWKYRYKRDVDV